MLSSAPLPSANKNVPCEQVGEEKPPLDPTSSRRGPGGTSRGLEEEQMLLQSFLKAGGEASGTNFPPAGKETCPPHKGYSAHLF